MIVDFDDIIARPSELASRIFKWIGLNDFKIKSSKPHNVTANPSVIEMQMKKIMPTSFRSLTPNFMRSGIKNFLRKKDAIISKKALTDKQKIKLREQLQPDIEQLGKHFDVNIHKWGF